jgi:hypothetical protein
MKSDKLLKKIKKSLAFYIRGMLVFILVFSWLYSGFPRIGNFPPRIEHAHAAITPTVRAVGAIASNAAAISPGLPTGTVAGDLLIMFVENSNEADQTASGWTHLSSTSTTGTRLTVLYKIAVGSDTTTTNDVGDHQIARIVGITAGTFDAADPFGAGTIVSGNQTSGTSKTIGGMTTTQPDSLVFGAIAGDLPDANGTANWASWANASLTSVTERVDNSSNAGNGGSLGVVSGIRAVAGALNNTTVTAASARVTAHMMFAVKGAPIVTTLGSGTDPATATIAPSASIADYGAFTVQTNSGTDSITALTVTLAGSGTPYDGVSEVRITSNDGATTYFSAISNPTSNTLNFSGGTPVPVTTSSVQFKIRITPKTHANMAAPAGASHALSPYVSAFTSTNTQAGSDTNANTLTIDNLSPDNVTSASVTAGDTQNVLNWTNPGGDFLETVVLRSLSGAISDTPVEGTAYVATDVIGDSTVTCVTSSNTCTNSGLTNGVAVHYKIFTRDLRGNYSQTGVVPTGSPATPVADDSPVQFIQQKTFAHTYLSPDTSISATLDTGATAGNLLITAVSIDKASGTISPPAGFTLIQKGEGGVASGAFAYKVAAGGETTVTWTYTTSEEGSMWVGEYSGLATSGVLDVSAENESFLNTTTASISTGTTGSTSQDDEFVIAMFAADSGNSVGATRSWTNSFISVAEVTETSGSPFLAVARKLLTTTGTTETTVSHSGSDESYAAIATFKVGGGPGEDEDPRIYSSQNQSFVIGQASTAISAIILKDGTTPSITAANDIRIAIATTSGFGMEWDTTDTTAVIGGDASAKVSTTVSYEGSSILVLNVTSDFVASDSITISGLSYRNFTAPAKSGQGALRMYSSGGASGTALATSSDIITITYPGASGGARQSIISRPNNYMAINNGLVGWWTFDGNDMVPNVRDRSGQGGHGNLTLGASGNTSTTTAPGRLGQALTFDGVDDYVNVSSFNPHTYNQVTASVWYKSSTSAVPDDGYIWVHQNGTTDEFLFGPTDDVDEVGKFRVAFNRGAGGFQPYFSSSVIVDTEWHHLVVVRTATHVKIYIDGVEETNEADTYAGLGITINAGSGPFIGDLPGGTEQIYGNLDDLRIYDRALSAEEVGILYRAGFARVGITTPTQQGSGSSSLVGHWTFDGKDMTPNIRDRSSQGAHGNLILGAGGNTSTTTAPGKIGQALVFDGTDDYVTIPSTISNVRTVSFWMKPNNLTQSVIDLNGTQTVTLSGGSVQANSFGGSTIYVNGAVSSTVGNGWNFVTITSDAVNASAINLGRVSTNYFNGIFDDVRVYSTVLSEDTIRSIYSSSRAIIRP